MGDSPCCFPTMRAYWQQDVLINLVERANEDWLFGNGFSKHLYRDRSRSPSGSASACRSARAISSPSLGQLRGTPLVAMVEST
jgi:hypothetical protein